MIRYSLKCAKAHTFESWFQSAEAFDSLQRSKHVECPICGNVEVEKLLMAPAIRPARKAEAAQATPTAVPQPPTTEEPSLQDLEKAIASIRAEVEANSEYVGNDFVAEARRMHAGEAPERAIYGEAPVQEAKKLVEEGVPVLPLPFLPKRKTN